MYFVLGVEIKSIKFLPGPTFLSCRIKDVLGLFLENAKIFSFVPSEEQSSAIKISKSKLVFWAAMLSRAFAINLF